MSRLNDQQFAVLLMLCIAAFAAFAGYVLFVDVLPTLVEHGQPVRLRGTLQ
jgi:hypothetical protein